MSKTLDLHRLLRPTALCEVVDIGANPIEGGLPPYRNLLDLGLCRVTGFEPQGDALTVLLQKKGPNETYLRDAIADGQRHRLHICRVPGMTSLLRPSKAATEVFTAFKVYGEVVREEEIATRRLDDVDEVKAIDFLKLDVQGSELSILQHGKAKLQRAVAVQAEVAFFPLYEDQPLLADVDQELRRQGFAPHCFFPAAIKTWCIAPMVLNGDPDRGLNQLLDGDLVYFRDLSKLDALDDEQLKQTALLAHDCYRSVDLALRCVGLLETRGTLASGSAGKYVEILRAPAAPG